MERSVLSRCYTSLSRIAPRSLDMPDNETPVTIMLNDVREGKPGATDKLLDAVYQSLKSIAASQHAKEHSDHTLNATALVSEAYLKVLGGEKVDFENRRHLFGAFARAMQEALIDAARRRNAKKRGSDFKRVPFESIIPPSAMQIADPLNLDRVLPKLQEDDPRAAEVVRFMCFLDLDLEDIALLLEVSTRTVQRDWQYAKAFLRRELSGLDGEDSELKSG